MNPTKVTRRVFVKKTTAIALTTVIAAQVLQAEAWNLSQKCSGIAGTCQKGQMAPADNNPFCASAQGGQQTQNCFLFKNADCASSYKKEKGYKNDVQTTVGGETRNCVW